MFLNNIFMDQFFLATIFFGQFLLTNISLDQKYFLTKFFLNKIVLFKFSWPNNVFNEIFGQIYFENHFLTKNFLTQFWKRIQNWFWKQGLQAKCLGLTEPQKGAGRACLEGVCKVPWRCLECLWKVSRRELEFDAVALWACCLIFLYL